MYIVIVIHSMVAAKHTCSIILSDRSPSFTQKPTNEGMFDNTKTYNKTMLNLHFGWLSPNLVPNDTYIFRPYIYRPKIYGIGTSVLNRILKFPLIYADLGFALLGSPKKLKKYSLIRFPSHGGFSVGFLKIPIDNMPIIHRDLPKWPRRSLGWTSVGKP